MRGEATEANHAWPPLVFRGRRPAQGTGAKVGVADRTALIRRPSLRLSASSLNIAPLPPCRVPPVLACLNGATNPGGGTVYPANGPGCPGNLSAFQVANRT